MICSHVLHNLLFQFFFHLYPLLTSAADPKLKGQGFAVTVAVVDYDV